MDESIAVARFLLRFCGGKSSLSWLETAALVDRILCFFDQRVDV